MMMRAHRLPLIAALAALAALEGMAQAPQRVVINDSTDFATKPPYVARGPEEQAKGFMLPAGYRMELVAADPDVDQPGGDRVRRQRPHVRRRAASAT